MINVNTLLSTFTEKGTLLKWLQKLEKALANSTLETVTVTQNDDQAIFNFNFTDNTSISTPPITLPRGADGAAGVDGTDGVSIQEFADGSPQVNGEYTFTPIEVTFTNGNKQTFTVSAKNGTNGTDGRSVTTFASGTPTTDPDQPNMTVTPVTAVYSDGSSPSNFNVYAKDGKDGTNGSSSTIYQITTPPATDGKVNMVGTTPAVSAVPVQVNDFVIYTKRVSATAYKTYLDRIVTVNNPMQVTVALQPIELTGASGANGNGIVTAHTLSHTTVGDEEVTTVELVTDDGTNPQIEIHAINGKDGGAITYLHHIGVYKNYQSTNSYYFNIILRTQDNTPINNKTLLLNALTTIQGSYTIPVSGTIFLASKGVIRGIRANSNDISIQYFLESDPLSPLTTTDALQFVSIVDVVE